MDVDFIKWMCEKAEGFSVLEYPACTHIRVPFSREHSVDIEDMYHLLSNNKHLKGYLLQRAKEGANRDFFCEGSRKSPWLILNNSHGYLVYYQQESGPRAEYLYDWPCESMEIDKAKEGALRYIYEQETGKS